VAVNEICGSGRQAATRLLVFDLSGRALARVTGADPFQASFAGDTLLFQANGLLLRYDLVTGTLAQLGSPETAQSLQGPSGAGSYVLWYDDDKAQVATFGG
jgi:hypothetical protein